MNAQELDRLTLVTEGPGHRPTVLPHRAEDRRLVDLRLNVAETPVV